MSMDRRKSCLIIFSKAPEVGIVKTRLRPYLNDEQCLSLHVALLKDAIQKSTLIDADVRLYLTSPTNLTFGVDVPIFTQRGADLGERMFNALQESFKVYGKCVIIGIDSPTIPPQWIQAALQDLDLHDVVLGPTEDGGYYLIGMNRLLEEPFHGIPWSTREVFQKTLQVLASYKVLLLNPCFDVDEPVDLERLEKELASLDSEYLSYTKSWFLQNKAGSR